MNFNLVTIEIQSFITVANIEAESPEHAVALATDIIDHKILIDRAQRPYFSDTPSGMITSIRSADVACSATVTVIDENNEATNLSCEISSDGTIYRANIPNRSEVVEAARNALILLQEAYEKCDDDDVKNDISRAYNTLVESGIDNSFPQFDSENDSNDSDDNTSDSDDEQEDFDQSLQARIIRSCFHESKLDTYRLEVPIFVSQLNPKEDDNSKEATQWNIDFGEIAIYEDNRKVGAIGSWKPFADNQLVYFDNEDDFEEAKLIILKANGIQQSFTEKPTLPGSLTATFSINTTTGDEQHNSDETTIAQTDV